MSHAWSEYIVYGYSAYSAYTYAAAVRPAVHIYITTAVYNIHAPLRRQTKMMWRASKVAPHAY